MTKTKTLAIRIDEDTMQRIEAFKEKLEKQVPGLQISFAEAARMAIKKGLDAEGATG